MKMGGGSEKEAQEQSSRKISPGEEAQGRYWEDNSKPGMVF